ncbi:MAG: TadE/TadG family type IV pilus assembly protein [Bryobacteraceae bacterium]
MRAKQRGQVLVEFAIVAVITICIMLSVLEVSRMLLVYTTIANSARAGVRYACLHGSTRTGSGVSGPSGPAGNPAQVVAVVKNFASAGLLNTSNLVITVTYPDGTNTPGDNVIVKVVYPYDAWITYFPMTPRLGSSSQGIIAF